MLVTLPSSMSKLDKHILGVQDLRHCYKVNVLQH